MWLYHNKNFVNLPKLTSKRPEVHPTVTNGIVCTLQRSRYTYKIDHKQQSATFGSGFSFSQSKNLAWWGITVIAALPTAWYSLISKISQGLTEGIQHVLMFKSLRLNGKHMTGTTTVMQNKKFPWDKWSSKFLSTKNPYSPQLEGPI